MMPAARCAIVGLVLSLWLPLAARAGQYLHHDLDVSLEPGSAAIEVRDTLTLPQGHAASLTFSLHPALDIELAGDNAKLTELTTGAAREPAPANASMAVTPRRYRVDLAAGQNSFTVRYSGSIAHALQSRGEEYARSFPQTQGMISPQGVFLSGASAWYPGVDASLISFDLQVRMPDGWKSMSQGESVDTGSARVEHWRALAPQEEIYLIAGPFITYTSVENGITAMVLLREADAALAQKYLDSTHQYIALYSELIGPYPFKKFALVENFWETGYGMPSFTLLGPRVIRLPFILYSSYPHEILHNWWGNSVYVDNDSGNWSEGLTSYLADYLFKEQRGSGAEYRRDTLQKYTDYVSRSGDFPLTEFRGRHSALTEAVGYGKTLMLFHMLRLQLGDAAFKNGLRTLYRQQRFRVADFADVRNSFAEAAGESLDGFFRQWVQRSGAPELALSDVRAEPDGRNFRLTAVIEQTQAGPAYRLHVPVAVHLDGVDQAWQTTVSLSQKRQSVVLEVPAQPYRLDVDPEFDVFRRLQASEIPPAISQAVGAEQVLVVLPGGAPAGMLEAYRALAGSWRQARPEQVQIVSDTALAALPADRTVWLFGWRNRFRPQLNAALKDYDIVQSGAGVRIAGTELSPQTRSLVVMARQPDAPSRALGWLAADSAAALGGLGRKLPHYGRYSYLAFKGTQPDNVLKGQWPVLDSPLSVRLAPPAAAVQQAPARLAPRKPLVAAPEQLSRARLQRHVAFLASEEMAGRGLGSVELDRAADYIAEQFRAAGLQAGGDNARSFFQVWQQRVGVPGGTTRLRNVIGLLPGSDPRHAGESLVIGAHYDHFGRGAYADHVEDRGKVHPGADDNASGVAVMLELARALAKQPQPRSLVFVAFTGEETGRLGSRYFVQHAVGNPAAGIVAMLNLDTVGRLGDQPVTLFGAGSAREWVDIFRHAGAVAGVAVQPVADDFGSSDQSSFIDAGIPAVQLFGSVHADIHRPGDTPDKIDVTGMLKVATVLEEAVVSLASRSQALTAVLSDDQRGGAGGDTPARRRVSLGTVPDFAFSGSGVRVDQVRAGSPAEQAGLQPGDVIFAVNDTPVHDLRDYAAALQQLNPGDTIRVRFRRADSERTVSTRVVER